MVVKQESSAQNKIEKILTFLTRSLAILGGLCVLAMSLLILVNVIGRGFFSSSVQGHVELVEIMTGLSVFSFLPYVQMQRANVIVDFIMSGSSNRIKTLCDALGGIIYLVIGTILTWRLSYGGVDMYTYNEMTPSLAIPRWITFPYSFLCMVILITTVAFTTWQSLSRFRLDKDPSQNLQARG